MKAIVSIHDLMPETMDSVEHIMRWLRRRGVPPVTLLVVPGKAWSPTQIRRLQTLTNLGYRLAAHGWSHYTQPKRLYHRLHASLISRNVAEHLALDSDGILDLLIRSQDWFEEHDLPTPSFYVPPAWALGAISKRDLAASPYTRIETLKGYYILEGKYSSMPINKRPIHFTHVPLTGFEADTPFRAKFLNYWNAKQIAKAEKTDIPLRISLHPDDLELRLRSQIQRLFEQPFEYVDEDFIA